MQKIFKHKKEPLYGRNTAELRVRPFKPSVLKQIMADAKPDYTKEDLLAMFTFTGGVAKYVSQLVDGGALDKEAMIRHIVSPNSTFLNEGKNNLIEQFGKDWHLFLHPLMHSQREEYSQRDRGCDRQGGWGISDQPG